MEQRLAIAHVELHRGESVMLGFTRAINDESALVVTDGDLDVGDQVLASLSLRGLTPAVSLPAIVTARHASGTTPGTTRTRGLELALHPRSGDERGRLLRLCARLAGPRIEALGYLRVLIVDDNYLIRDMFAYGVRRYFRQRSCDVAIELAPDGGAAWQRLQQGTYDLVLVDQYMPVLDGARLTALIRADARLRAIPVVAVSGGSALARHQCMSAGADVYLQKPLVFRDLLETLGGLVPGSAG